MKRWFTLLFLVGIMILLGTGMVFSADNAIAIQLDGKEVETDVNPIIEEGRTLVPYRALLESMGGKVLWEPEARMATAVLGSRKVQVTIDNITGFVNGITKGMDVPPRIINSRTMIPLRFVLENLNCTVDWDQQTRTVLINSPKTIKSTEITDITLEETDTSYRIIAKGDGLIEGTRTFAYEDPERYGIDIKNALFLGGNGSLLEENEVFSKVRFSQFDEETVRIVTDLKEKVAGKVSLSEDRTTLYIDFDKPEVQGSESESQLDWRAAGKLIAIDIGHGGRDPGAEGKRNGDHVVWEKDLNLAIGLRLYELLKNAGANVVLLRETDVTMSLYTRPESANAINADLLVSIHNNSSESPKPNGTEVLYYSKNGEKDYGFTSQYIASFVQKEMVTAIGLMDRGIKNAPQYALLNKSLMPAIIIEGGFLSHPGDLEVMVADDYPEVYAGAVAKGIINSLNAIVDK
ncbi:MAG: N-acetylmuramoyl-L-alanine amidase family protein [Eubacteriales bacterium]|nr:N-acetylmuramoyl-L-alanine amidase family protein [Eubacteriales bacterium]